MKNWRRWTAVIMTALMAAGLTGCSSSSPSAQKNSDGGVSQEQKDNVSRESNSAKAENNDSAGEKVTLEFYSWLDEEKIFTLLTEEYKKDHPNIDFNLHFVPTNDYETKLLTAFSGGASIDCFAVASAPSFAAYQNKGQVYCIDDLVTENKTDTSGFQASYDGLKVDGKAYVLPYKTSSWVVYYNKDIFDNAGVPYPSEEWTWEEYAQTAAKLTGGDGNDKIYGSLNYQPTSTWWRVPANGMKATNPLIEAQLDEWLKAAEFNKKLSDDGYQPPYADRANEAGADYSGAFLQGKYGMFYNGDWVIEMLNTAIDDGETLNYDIAPLPHWEGQPPMTTGTPGLLMIAQNSKHPKEAYDFLSFASGEKGAEILAHNDYFPAWSSDSVIKAYTEGRERPEHIEYIVNQEIYPQVPCDPKYNTATNIVKEEVSLYLLGEQDIDKTKSTISERFVNEMDVQ